ncbi:carboxymuconolactone decarboxylase family protein [Nocardioides nitrophenolicus]|uniref:carboxymuconolactone decarboxylase family protein n=1 Tax=Nocardioides nitrophenolicus TaxID=60489 RepID=UPI0019593B67|nr:carboxymuconolactone decarboxylase family protein [Nocardioides nitrophenolicus]MBM7518592.1 alkylhydroperoxidase family enzyme [Nocardioides nitrophenolicus]
MTASAAVPLLGRAPWTSAGEVDAAQRALIDMIASAWGDAGLGVSPVDAEGRLTGPFDLMAASPVVGGAVLALAGAFRDGLLTTAEREVAILVVAALDDSPYMRAGHEPLAVAAGVEASVVAAIRASAELPADLPDARWRDVHDVAAELCRTGDLTDASFDRAVRALGWPRLQELVWLVGHYRSLATAQRVARVPDPTSEG